MCLLSASTKCLALCLQCWSFTALRMKWSTSHMVWRSMSAVHVHLRRCGLKVPGTTTSNSTHSISTDSSGLSTSTWLQSVHKLTFSDWLTQPYCSDFSSKVLVIKNSRGHWFHHLHLPSTEDCIVYYSFAPFIKKPKSWSNSSCFSLPWRKICSVRKCKNLIHKCW